MPPTFWINYRLHLGLVVSSLIYSLHLVFRPSHCPIALHVRLAEPRSLYCPVQLYVTTLPKLNPLLSLCCEFFGLGGGLHLRSEMKRDYLSEVKQIIKYRLPHILQWRVDLTFFWPLFLKERHKLYLVLTSSKTAFCPFNRVRVSNTQHFFKVKKYTIMRLNVR